MPGIDFERDVGIHVATRQPIDCGQWLVWWSGRVVGYLGDEPGSPLNLIERLVPYVHDELRRAVVERFGWAPRAVTEPPVMPERRRRRR